jgi:hypothetical protein
MDAEQQRILQNAGESRPWQQWGSYLSERQWGTVREDYSPCYWAQKAGGGYRKIEEVKSLSELIRPCRLYLRSKDMVPELAEGLSFTLTGCLYIYNTGNCDGQFFWR